MHISLFDMLMRIIIVHILSQFVISVNTILWTEVEVCVLKIFQVFKNLTALLFFF